jgi:hypothetical protein
MVTRAQLDKLACRIDELALALAPPEERVRYVCYLSFYGETKEDFYARYPDASRPFTGITLDFGHPVGGCKP